MVKIAAELPKLSQI